MSEDEHGRSQMTLEEWRAEGERRFGETGREWKFRCVRCGEVQSGQDFIDAGLSEEKARGMAYFSCIGRVVEGRGCDWTLGGLLQMHKLEVVDEEGEAVPVFEFARNPEDATDARRG